MLHDIPPLSSVAEQARLQALLPYKNMKVVPDALFSTLVDLISRVFDVPLVLLTLVDEHETYFKASYGVTLSKVPREHSLCALTVLQNTTLVSEDLRQESQSIENFTYACAINMRFYAGHPIQTAQGHNIGALCILDSRVRTFNKPERMQLQEFAQLTSLLLTMRIHLQAHQPMPSPEWISLYDILYATLDQLDESDARLQHLRTLSKEAQRLNQQILYKHCATMSAKIQKRIMQIQTLFL